jgi:predicted Zn-dependent protease
MLARAGYNIDAGDNFWKRLAATHPVTVLNGYMANHPGIDARIAAIDKTVAEVKAKRSAKKPLLP